MKPPEENTKAGFSRRDWLRRAALSLTAAGAAPLSLAAAQHVHQEAAKQAGGGKYEPEAFNPHEYATLERLAELIVPADAHSGSAKDAGAAPFIDLLCSQNPELLQTYTGGLLWLDGEMRRRGGAAFLDAKPEQQTKLLDDLVQASLSMAQRKEEAEQGKAAPDDYYGARPLDDLSGGLKFWSWVTRMTVDAFYTSEIGIQDLQYKGNGAYASYEVPKEAIEYAMKRSPV